MRALPRLLRGAPSSRSRRYCGSVAGSVTLGGVSLDVHHPSSMHLVPSHSPLPDTEAVLEQLRWMMQKHALGQDIFLMGPPGSRRRHLAMKFCQALMREVEYLSLSRDTTEADIKQRREMQGGRLVFVDQAAVRAAIHGRVLILEGVERAERNVLPIINNLLENREMALEDGRFLTSPARWDKMLESGHTEDELSRMGLVRVSPRFMVIAIGLPVPPFPGAPLDPPFRSRFQCLNVEPTDLASVASVVRSQIDDGAKVDTIVGMYLGLKAANEAGSDQDQSARFLDLTEEDVSAWAVTAGSFPDDPLVASLRRVYPYPTLTEASATPDSNRDFFCGVLSKYGMRDEAYAKGRPLPPNTYKLGRITPEKSPDGTRYANVEFISNVSGTSLTIGCGCGEAPTSRWTEVGQTMVLTPTLASVLTDMVKDHCLNQHLCLVGDAGSGKTALLNEFASILGYAPKIETLHCHYDMSARDLLQRRTTNEHGDSVWEPTSVLTAAIKGRLAVLDSVDKLQPGVLASLSRLLKDKEITLYDGSVLTTPAGYERLRTTMDEDQLQSLRIHMVHPAFRVVAVAHPPKKGGKMWLEGEVQHLFAFHAIPSLPPNEVASILRGRGADSEVITKLTTLAKRLDEARQDDPNVPLLSLRQLLRIGVAGGDLYRRVADTLLMEIMPAFAAERVENIVRSVGIESTKTEGPIPHPVVTTTPTSRTVTIGDVSLTVRGTLEGQEAALVPTVNFCDNEEHTATLQRLLEDFAGKQHILMIGKQGVGKNRLIDRLLELLDRPREYIQLHRDSTVASLTVRPSVQDGRVTWEDAPLVKALVKGHVLVVDEIDKAPLEVVGVLKGLLEDKNLALSDGRRIVAPDSSEGAWCAEEDRAITIHPDFQLVALANVPGYPFMGNDFFSVCGDLFHCHFVDNPNRASRLAVLKDYAPNVDNECLNMMINAFEQLDKLVADGLLAYPYSLRELVNVVKHMNKFPADGLVQALHNVFDFDSFDPNTHSLITQVFESNGIPLKKAELMLCCLAEAVHLAPPASGGTIRATPVDEKEGSVSIEPLPYQPKDWKWNHNPPLRSAAVPGRDEVFDELVYTLPLPVQGTVRGLGATADGMLHALVDGGRVGPVLVTWSRKQQYLVTAALPTVHDHAQYTLMELKNFTPGGQLMCTRDRVVIPCPKSGKLAVLNPSLREGIVVPLPIFDSDASGKGLSSWMPFARNAGSDVVMDPASAQHGLAVLWTPSGRINVVSLLSAKCFEVVLEGLAIGDAVQAVRTLSPRLIGVEAERGTFLIKLTDSAPLLYRIESPDGSATEFVKTLPAVVASEEGQPRRFSTQGGLGWLQGDLFESGRLTVASHPSDLAIPVSPATPSGSTMANSKLYHHDPAGRQVVHYDYEKMVMYQIPIRPTAGKEEQDEGNPLPLVAYLPNGCVAVPSPSYKEVCVYDCNTYRTQETWGRWQTLMGGRRTVLDKTTGKRVAEELKMQYSNSAIEPSSLKHGKVDPDNTPHVGGNQWAGGTGGTDTAGLGGKVGPYRLDAGHPVHRVSEEAKKAVPEHLKEQAKQMGKEALAKRLKEIEMSSEENSMYTRAYEHVQKEIALMQTMLRGLKSKEGEREWVKHQSDGVWDENKLVEGIAGDKNIFKKRGASSESSHKRERKKRMVFCFDCSASMYSFNSVDQRLDRSVEAAIMIMESLKGMEDRIEYEVIGHSGDDAAIELIPFGKPPMNKKERLEMALKMVAHSQYCWSGDNTLRSMEEAIRRVTEKDADQYFVFALSDANLQRYGISTRRIAQIVNSDPRVHMYCVFIASFGMQANAIVRDLPPGHGHVCLQSSDLPAILKKIFLGTGVLK
eukprot:Sspe_Gene.9679::Locus_3257_Transcript_1_1_Confidence_1.000_Length_5642::g.9679::m.9679